MTRTRIALFAASAALTALALTACAPAASEQPPAQGASAKTSAPKETKPARDPAEAPTCENLVTPSLNAQLKEQGWTFRQDPFFIGSTKLDAGIQCTWGDFAGPSNDNVQVYGFSEIDDATAAKAEEELVAQGWIREEADGSLYFTQDPKTAAQTDADGYGLTYQFGDGWVRYSDTKQGLVLITWP